MYTSFLNYLISTWPIEMSLLTCQLGNKIDKNDEVWEDLDAGLDCLQYAAKANWWEMAGGSRLFYWRWTSEFNRYVRDDIPICWPPNKQPTARKPQPPVLEKKVQERMKVKPKKVRDRVFVASGFVRSLI